ncbi:hypothetical protein ACCY16_00780 [Candidatus Pantoea formicae]|uniref:hypothetical protein n=1 Tax=Candidatus Pantoea formicae TaxID=2608355 RepID=UPI003EDB6A21
MQAVFFGQSSLKNFTQPESEHLFNAQHGYCYFPGSLNALPVPFSLRQRYIKVNFKNQLLSVARFNSVREIIYFTAKSPKQVIGITLCVFFVDITRIETRQNSLFFIFLLINFTSSMAHLQWHLSSVLSLLLSFNIIGYRNFDDIFILAANLSLISESASTSAHHHASLAFNARMNFDQSKSVMAIKFVVKPNVIKAKISIRHSL